MNRVHAFLKNELEHDKKLIEQVLGVLWVIIFGSWNVVFWFIVVLVGLMPVFGLIAFLFGD